MYLKILQKSIFLKLAIIQFLIYFGSFFTSVAIYTMIINFKVTPTQNAIIVATFSAPALLGFFTGSIVDKFNLIKFMKIILTLEIFFTSLLLTITSITDFYLLVIFIFFRMLCAFLFFTAQMSLFPLIAYDKEELKSLNELHSVIWSATFALGMSVGGIFVNSVGVYNTIKIDITLFIIAFFIFNTLHFHLKPKAKMKLFILIKDGFNYLKSNKKLLSLMIIHGSIALTSFDTIVNLLTQNYYKYIIAIPLSIGFINGFRAFALMIGPIFVSKYVNTKNLHLFLTMQALFIIIWALIQHNFYLSLAWMFVLGFLTTTLWSFTYTLIQTNCDKNYLGRVVAYNDTIFMTISIAVSFFSGYMYEKGISLKFITMILGLLFIFFAIYYKLIVEKTLNNK